jgi:steroid 5-alpha reductase family enzyme
LRVIYLLQAGLLFFVSIPLQWIAFSPRFSPAVVVVGLALSAVGIGFESIGDVQLQRFLANPANEGTTMNRGLWRYTVTPTTSGTP